jgi:hypothetical protein
MAGRRAIILRSAAFVLRMMTMTKRRQGIAYQVATTAVVVAFIAFMIFIRR